MHDMEKQQNITMLRNLGLTRQKLTDAQNANPFMKVAKSEAAIVSAVELLGQVTLRLVEVTEKLDEAKTLIQYQENRLVKVEGQIAKLSARLG